MPSPPTIVDAGITITTGTTRGFLLSAAFNAKAGDLVYVINFTRGEGHVTSISAASNITLGSFTKRGDSSAVDPWGDGSLVEIWWGRVTADVSGGNSSIDITIDTSLPFQTAMLVIRGAPSSGDPFDPQADLPKFVTGDTIAIDTENAVDLLIAAGFNADVGNAPLYADQIYRGIRSIGGKSTGKFHFEAAVDESTSDWGVGVGNASALLDNFAGANNDSIGYFASGNVWLNNSAVGSAGSFSDGSIIEVELDADGQTIQFRPNNAASWSSFSIAALGAGPYYIFWSSVADQDAVTLNTGADAFDGALSSGYSAWGASDSWNAADKSDGVTLSGGDLSAILVWDWSAVARNGWFNTAGTTISARTVTSEQSGTAATMLGAGGGEAAALMLADAIMAAPPVEVTVNQTIPAFRQTARGGVVTANERAEIERLTGRILLVEIDVYQEN